MKPGLYANIHAKRKRIKAGSGEKMRQVGSQGAPTQQSFIDSAKTAKKAGGGMMNINRMTAPLGYANGGPAGMTQPERENVEYARMMKEFEESVGPKEPGMFYKGLQKITGDETVDPMWKAKDKLKDLGSKGLEGIRSLFGAKEAGASELSDKIKQLENLEFLRTMSLGMPGSTLFTPSSPETIERLDKQIRDLRLEIFGEE